MKNACEEVQKVTDCQEQVTLKSYSQLYEEFTTYNKLQQIIRKLPSTRCRIKL